MRMPEWFWQGSIVALVIRGLEALAILGFGILVAYLQTKGSTVVAPIMYGIGAAAVMSVLIVALHYLVSMGMRERPVDVTNVEAHVRKWFDAFRYGVQRADDKNSIFRLRVTSPTGSRTFFIRQLKEPDRYLYLSVTLRPAEDVRGRIDRLSEAQKQALIGQWMLEMVRQGIAYGNVTTENIPLERRIPITSQLTESVFVTDLLDFEGAMASIVLITSLPVAN